MIELIKALHAHLKTLHDRVYFQRAHDGTPFPYLVYNIPSLHDDGEGFQFITLDIDGWDAPETVDTTAIENLMTAVNAGMNKKTIVTESFAVTFYLESKLPLEDDDPRVKRRKYVYQGRLFERG